MLFLAYLCTWKAKVFGLGKLFYIYPNLFVYRGKVLLITNVASQCGYTDSHYKDLKQMYDVLGLSKKLEILGFPCNQFGKQEPWGEEGIKVIIIIIIRLARRKKKSPDFDLIFSSQNFVVEKYNVDFPMFSKVEVHAELAHPVWKYLTGKDTT